jgi:hypothetical protein
VVKNVEVINELERIAKARHGELRVQDVVEAARPAASPLHSWFNWDDTEAAHQWRLQQARQLIRVTIAYVGDNEDSIPIRVFVSLTTDRYNKDGGGYRVTTAVLSDAEHRQQLLDDAMAEMKRFRAKYNSLKELAEVFDAMTASERRLHPKAA